jgi:hypothetical protein
VIADADGIGVEVLMVKPTDIKSIKESVQMFSELIPPDVFLPKRGSSRTGGMSDVQFNQYWQQMYNLPIVPVPPWELPIEEWTLVIEQYAWPNVANMHHVVDYYWLEWEGHKLTPRLFVSQLGPPPILWGRTYPWASGDFANRGVLDFLTSINSPYPRTLSLYSQVTKHPLLDELFVPNDCSDALAIWSTYYMDGDTLVDNRPEMYPLP